VNDSSAALVTSRERAVGFIAAALFSDIVK
jgi:hypothetical protein